MINDVSLRTLTEMYERGQ